MFIVSKRNFLIPRKDGSKFAISRDGMAEIPDDVAAHWLVKAAIEDGLIMTPENHSDKAISKAEDVAKVAEDAADIRPDAKETKRKRSK